MRHSRPSNKYLCCCEYLDKDGNVNHVFACCCNCVELDNACDSLFCCRNKKLSFRPILKVVEDRMRIPWQGGAKQVPLDGILPIIILTVMFFISAQNLPLTIITFFSVPILICQLHRSYLQYIPQTNFYITWTCTSFAIQFLIYEFEVVPYLLIDFHENALFVGLSFVAGFCLYKVKSLNGSCVAKVDEELGAHHNSSNQDSICSSCCVAVPPRSGHCRLCQTCIGNRELHCLWFGTCIGSHNLLWFLLCLLSLSGALLSSVSLILTTACRPFHFWAFILLPEDCSDVYYEFRYALCFVSALYSLVMSVLVIWSLLCHCWMVTLGITYNEWRSLPLVHKCRLGITGHRPYSRGPICNWFNLLTCRHNSGAM